MGLVLFHMPHSPWSQKTRWALCHHRLDVEKVTYAPLLGEPGLRLRLVRAGGPWTGRVSVPMLFSPEGPLCESWDIVAYADRTGHGAPLVPETQAEEVAGWNALSDRLLSAGRARFMLRASRDADALRELSPSATSGLPVPMLRGSIAMFNAKYGIRERDYAGHEDTLKRTLAELREALCDGRSYLTGTLSYADIAMGIGLQVISPLPGTAFGPASEVFMREPELADTYADLLQWRDRVHAAHNLVC